MLKVVLLITYTAHLFCQIPGCCVLNRYCYSDYLLVCVIPLHRNEKKKLGQMNNRLLVAKTVFLARLLQL